MLRIVTVMVGFAVSFCLMADDAEVFAPSMRDVRRGAGWRSLQGYWTVIL